MKLCDHSAVFKSSMVVCHISCVDIYSSDSCLSKYCVPVQVEVVVKSSVGLKWAALASNWFCKGRHFISMNDSRIN